MTSAAELVVIEQRSRDLLDPFVRYGEPPDPLAHLRDDGAWPADVILPHTAVEHDGFVVPLFAETPDHAERREWEARRAARGIRRRRDPRLARWRMEGLWTV